MFRAEVFPKFKKWAESKTSTPSGRREIYKAFNDVVALEQAKRHEKRTANDLWKSILMYFILSDVKYYKNDDYTQGEATNPLEVTDRSWEFALSYLKLSQLYTLAYLVLAWEIIDSGEGFDQITTTGVWDAQEPFSSGDIALLDPETESNEDNSTDEDDNEDLDESNDVDDDDFFDDDDDDGPTRWEDLFNL